MERLIFQCAHALRRNVCVPYFYGLKYDMMEVLIVSIYFVKEHVNKGQAYIRSYKSGRRRVGGL